MSRTTESGSQVDNGQWEEFRGTINEIKDSLREVVETLRGCGSKTGLVADVRSLEQLAQRHANDIANHDKYIKQLESSRLRIRGATVVVVCVWTVLTPFLVVLLEHLLK